MSNVVKICVFNKNTPKSTVILSNGDAILDNICTSCQITENLDGTYELDAEFRVDEDGLWKNLEEEAILKVKVDYGDEYFRIIQPYKKRNRITVYAIQVTIYEEMHLWLNDVRPTDLNGAAAINWILDGATGVKELEVYSNISASNTAYYEDMNMYQALHDCDQSFQNRWGGEIQRRGYMLKILDAVGEDRGVQVRSNKNLTGFECKTNVESIVTRIKPKGYDGITADYVDSPIINKYPRVKTKEFNYSNVKVKSSEDDEEGFNTLEEAQAELKRLAELEFTENKIDIISADYTINFVDLSKTEEYKSYVKAERVYIGDIVSVYEEKLDINISVRAIERTYDILAQKVKEIKLSNKNITKKSVNDVMIDITKEVEKNDNSLEKWIQSFINAGIKDSYVFYNKEELVVCDSPTIEEAIHVWRFNKNGLAHSANGYQGPYNVALTSDGKVNANMILAGTLKGQYIDARNLTVTDGNGDITLAVSSDGEVSIKEGLIQLNQDGIAVNHTNQENTEVAKTVMDEEGFRILDRNGNPLADIGAQGAHFANLGIDGRFNHYPTAQIISRQRGWTAEYYVAKIATGDGTGRNESNKADSLQTVLEYIKDNEGCIFFDAIYIYLEDGVRVNEKIVLQDFYGTLLFIIMGKDSVIRMKEGSVLEDNRCRILFNDPANPEFITEDTTTSETINKFGCIEIEDDNGLYIRHCSHVEMTNIRVRGKSNNRFGFNCIGSSLVNLNGCDVSNIKTLARVESTSNLQLTYCRGNVERLAEVEFGGKFAKGFEVPVCTSGEITKLYGSGVDLTKDNTNITYCDTLFQDTYSSDTDTNTMRIYNSIREFTEKEGEGNEDTANLINLVGQGRYKEGYKNLHGYAIFNQANSTDGNHINSETLKEFASTRENYNIYLRMTRVDTNKNAVVPRVRFQLENGEYTAYYKLDPLTSPLVGDGSGAQIIDYNPTEDRKLPQELADKLAKFGVYSVEFQSDLVEDYLIVDDVALVIKGNGKTTVEEDPTEVKATAKILANALNVRKTPGTSGEYAGLLAYGDTVEIVGVDPDTGWYKIKWENGYAYITNKSEYVEIISGDPNGTSTVQKIEVLAENLNVRSGPGTGNSSIGIVQKGFVADILETDPNTGWYKISYNGDYGWVTNNTTYVKVITGTATVTKELYNGAKVAEIAESYYNARNNYTSATSWDNGFTYGERTPIDSNASGTQGASYSIWEKSTSGNYWKMIDDSTLITLCLQGYNYNDSPYASLTKFNSYRQNRLQTNSSYSGGISPTVSAGNQARTCAEIAQYFYNLGQTITMKDDYSNLQKGDLIFYARKNSSGNYIYPNRWNHISAGAICIGQDSSGNAQIITAMSNPGEKHTDGWYVGLKKDLVKNQQPSTIVLAVRPSTKVTSSGGTTSGGTTSGNTGGTTQVTNNKRDIICDTAMSIVNMATKHQAWYSQYYRTISLSKLNTIKAKSETLGGTTYYQPSWVVPYETYGFDCSSMVGCCYEKAGISYMKGLTCSGGTLQSTAKSHGATFWRYKDSGLTKCKPGDIVMYANNGYTVTTTNMATVRTHHTAIYMGNGYIAEASGYKVGIVYHKRTFNNQCFFIRLPELTNADNTSSPVVTVKEEYKNCFNERGTIDGKSYIYRLHGARCTCYSAPESNTSGASGLGCHMGKTVGSFNIPYGTKIYIPGLKGRVWTNANGTKVTLDGVFTVTDTGVGCTDFDIVAGSTSSACFSNYSNPTRQEVYVLEWGTSTKQTWSYTDSYKWAYNNGVLSRYKSAFKNYISNGGVLINMLKFYNDDANIRSSIYWNILNS